MAVHPLAEITVSLYMDIQSGFEREFGRKDEMGDCLLVAVRLRDGLRDAGFEAVGGHGKLGPYPHWYVICEGVALDPLGRSFYPEYRVEGCEQDAAMDAEHEALQKLLRAGVDVKRYGLDIGYQKEVREKLL